MRREPDATRVEKAADSRRDPQRRRHASAETRDLADTATGRIRRTYGSVLRLQDVFVGNCAIRWRRRARDNEVIDQHQYAESDEAPRRLAEDADADRDRHESDDS